MTRSELKKLGVTYVDTDTVQGGLIDRKIPPMLICDECDSSWLMPVVKVGIGNVSLPDDYWICPQGCNKTQA
jgi:hypothetical protein